MKHVILLLVFCFALSSFAQIIEGGSNPPTEIFSFQIMENLGSRTVDPSVTLFFTDRSDYSSYLRCNYHYNGIIFANSRNETTLFHFDDSHKCEIIRNCIQDMHADEVIYVDVDRASKSLARIVIPFSCSTDPWN